MVDVTPQLETYLRESVIPLRLAAVSATEWPLVLSLWYLYDAGKIYCATQRSAKIVSHLQYNPKVAFEIAADSPPYCGVRGQGTATIDSQNGAGILEKLLHRYLGGTDSPLARNLMAKSANEVAIVIEPNRFFTWNFRKRMSNSIPDADVSKPCPE